jgi:hypothetical protein
LSRNHAWKARIRSRDFLLSVVGIVLTSEHYGGRIAVGFSASAVAEARSLSHPV